MNRALSGVQVLDMTHVQSGPMATQILAWLGADVIKIEPPGIGDVTRSQLRDLPDVDSLYFTMLNCNKRSITLNMKSPAGTQIFTKLITRADVLVENFGPGVVDRFGFSWEKLQEINPQLIYASIKGFGSERYATYKAYEVIAQAMGGSMSTTGFEDGPPTVTGAQIGDSGTGIHLVAAILAALYQRVSSGRGQRVQVAMQDAVINLCRVKLRDQQRLTRGALSEYPNDSFSDEVPRSGNASGGGHPGWAVRCKPGGPNDYVYIIIQPRIWPALAELIGRGDLAEDPAWATPEARLPKLAKVFSLIEEWTKQYTKWEVTQRLHSQGIPSGPILSAKEILEDEALAGSGVIVSVTHPARGAFKSVGCPLRLSDSPVQVETSPLLGEHNDVIYADLGYSAEQLSELRTDGVI